jgi:hypothetical protein
MDTTGDRILIIGRLPLNGTITNVIGDIALVIVVSSLLGALASIVQAA